MIKRKITAPNRKMGPLWCPVCLWSPLFDQAGGCVFWSLSESEMMVDPESLNQTIMDREYHWPDDWYPPLIHTIHLAYDISSSRFATLRILCNRFELLIQCPPDSNSSLLNSWPCLSLTLEDGGEFAVNSALTTRYRLQRREGEGWDCGF